MQVHRASRLMSHARSRRVGIVHGAASQSSASARFATGLADSLSDHHEIARIVSRTPALPDVHPGLPRATLRRPAAIAAELNSCDVAVIHHSVDDDVPQRAHAAAFGDCMLDVVELVDVPTIVVLHHVPADPTADQRRTLIEACRSADAVAVTAAPAALRLASTYGVDPSALWLLRSGPTSGPGASRRTRRPTVVTWGAVAPGGGIEWMIDAMQPLSAVDVQYVIAGPSSVDPPAGEAANYRETLIRRSWVRGVAAHVTFEGDDADQTAMTETLRNAIAVVMPQDVAGEQIDGFFDEIVAAGVPIVATDLATAGQILPSGTGFLVPPRDPAALADAVLRIMIEPHLTQSVVRSATQGFPPTTWPAVARQFDRLADAVIRSTPAVWRHAV